MTKINNTRKLAKNVLSGEADMFDTSYPLPGHAVALSLRADGDVQVYMPGRKGDGHTFKVSPTAHGFAAIIRVLKERQAAEPDERSVRGDMIAPTQQIVDQWLRHNEPTRSVGPEPQVKTKVDIDSLLKGYGK